MLEKRYLSIIRPILRDLTRTAGQPYTTDIEFQFKMHYGVDGVTQKEYIAAIDWLINQLDAAESMIDRG